jgi:hypothetical protein
VATVFRPKRKQENLHPDVGTNNQKSSDQQNIILATFSSTVRPTATI